MSSVRAMYLYHIYLLFLSLCPQHFWWHFQSSVLLVFSWTSGLPLVSLLSSCPCLMLSSFPLLQLHNHSNATSCSSGLHSFALACGQQQPSRIKIRSRSLLTTVLRVRLPSGGLFDAIFNLDTGN